MRKQANKLKRLVDVRSRQRDVAAASFNTTRLAHNAAVEARDESVRAISDLTTGVEISPAELEQLGQVIAYRAKQVEQAANDLDITRSALMSAGVALDRAEKLHTRAANEARAHTLHAEQREMDDRAGAAGGRR
jgi:flagellar biosynthesis chaperone FliJ